MSGVCKWCGKGLGSGDDEANHAGECPVMNADSSPENTEMEASK